MCGNELFVGITSWNSEEFLPRSIRAAQGSTEGQTTLDDGSEDASAKLAQDLANVARQSWEDRMKAFN